LAKIDENIEDEKIFIKDNNYETIKELLYYAIIENKQPLYTQSVNVIINKEEMNEYLRLELYWGQSYVSALIELAKKNNMYACAKLAALEYDGEISGERNYKKAYEYYLKAANKNHPKACWMIAYLMLSNYIEYDFDLMWKYLNKAIELGSSAAYNTMGICYLKGINKNNQIDLEKAKYYFEISSELGYVFAFNNLGKMNELNEEESIKYYKISADMNNSWALNKVGEYYRKNNDLITAYYYYEKSIDCPINEINKYGYYNLAKYYYLKGFKELNIKEDKVKAQKYFDIFTKNTLKK
jgi:TPR repeat protein